MSKLSKEPYAIDDFLEGEGVDDEVKTFAIKQVIARQIAKAMKTENITKKARAAKMHTSRSQLDRLLDPEHTGITLEVLAKAARAVGRELRLELA